MRLKLASIIAAILPALAHADAPSINIDNLPIFYDMIGYKPMYHDAAFKAQQALFVQLGLTPAIDQFTRYATDETTNKVTMVINKSNVVSADTVFFLGGTAYVVFVQKQLTRRFHNPLTRLITHTITVSPTEVMTSAQLQIPF
jgi:hypothetical protein